MATKVIKLEVITQEELVLSTTVDQLTVPAVMGEVTILPEHIPLFTRLNDGILVLKYKEKVEEMAILGGFMDVGPENKVTIMADAAFRASSVNVAKAEQAKKDAEKAMKQKGDEVDFRLAESEPYWS